MLVHIGPVRDTHQRVMGLVERDFREVDIVGSHQWQAFGISHLNEPALRQCLRLGQASPVRVALQFNIQTIRINRSKAIHQRLGGRALARAQQPPNRPIRATSQTDEPCVVFLQIVQRDLRHLIALIEIEAGIKLHQVQITRFGLREQNDPRRVFLPFALLDHSIPEINLTADDRLDARL